MTPPTPGTPAPGNPERPDDRAASPDSPADLDATLHALFAGQLSDADERALADRLLTDPAARAAYLDHLDLHGLLAWELGDRAAPPTAASSPTTASSDAPSPSPPKPHAAAQRGVGVSPLFRLPRPFLALAAAVLLFAAAVTLYLATAPASNSPPDTPNAKPGSPVATVLDTTDGGTLLADGQLVQPGATVSSGELTLDRGSASVEFTNGVALTVHDAARLIVHDPMHATLAAGAADFHVPSNATGFTVDLPDGSRIVDLGTRFRVRIGDDGVSYVRTLEGRVRLERDAERYPLPAGHVRQIRPGSISDLSDPFTEPDPATDLRFDLPDTRTPLDLNRLQPVALHGSATQSDTGGGPALALNGRGHATFDPDDADAPIGARLTVAAWVRLDSRERQAIVHRCVGDPSYSIEVYREKPAFVVSLQGHRNAIHVNADAPMPTDRWVLLVGVYDGQSVSLYVDGERAAREPAPRGERLVNRSTGPIFVGRRSDRDADPVRGRVARVAVYHAALTPQQIQQLYATRPAAFPNPGTEPAGPQP